MKPLTSLAVLCGLCMCSAEAIDAQQRFPQAEANGTWQGKHGTFKIWALDGERLQVEFLGLHVFKSGAGVTANTGSAKGVARMDGSVAKLRPDGTEEACLITLQFVKRTLAVEQQGDCGFGLNVTAAGTYRKVNARKPDFSAS